MSDYESSSSVGSERCQCGRKAEPGRECCRECLLGLEPEPTQPNPQEQADLFMRTAAMLRKLAKGYTSKEAREAALADALYFEKRAAQATGAREVA